MIPNALDKEAFAETVSVLPAIAGGLRVAMISRMNDPAKRHDVFLRSAARLAVKYPRVEFVLAGDGPLRPGLEEMAAKLNLGQRSVFLGDRRDVAAVLASSDISVLTSSSESLSNAVMESMAAGVPVVACRVGGNDELIRDGENGFLVAPGSHEEVAERIEKLVNERDLRKSFGTAAKRDAQKAFSGRVCGQYANLYISLMEEKGIAAQPLVQPVS